MQLFLSILKLLSAIFYQVLIFSSNDRPSKTIHTAWSMRESQSWKSKIATKMWRFKRWWYLSKLLTITITNFNFFYCPVKFSRNMKVKFRSKFNHGFTNQGYLHSAVWKALYNFKIKRDQEARHNQFFFQNVQNNEIFEISKCLKTTVELTFTSFTSINI